MRRRTVVLGVALLGWGLVSWALRSSPQPFVAPGIGARPPQGVQLGPDPDHWGTPYPNPAGAAHARPAAPAFGPDVRISFDTPGRPHNEPFVAADPLNPLHFIAAANEYAAGRGLGFWYTQDGGTTWHGGPVEGPYPGGASIQPQADASGDIDAGGNSYFADLGFNYSNTCLGGVYLHRSTDGGATFSPPVLAAPSSDRQMLDKSWLTANKQSSGPYTGWLYLTYSDFQIGSGCNFAGFQGEVAELRYSSDQGATWSAPVTLPQPTDPVPASSGTQSAVAADGTVYVTYNYGTGIVPNAQQLYVTRSTDGGRTFALPVSVTGAPITPVGVIDPQDGHQYYRGDDSGHTFRAPQFPVLAVSPSDPQRVYLVWNHAQAGWDTTYTAPCCHGSPTLRTFNAGDIAFASSSDGGQTWSAPRRLNDDALNNAQDQFLPWLTVAANGAIHVTWYDRRDDPLNRLYQVYYTRSTDGGRTWLPNERISDAASDPVRVLFGGGDGFIGDYSALAANSERVLPIWADGRTSLPAGEQQLETDPYLTALETTPTSTPGETPPATASPSPTPAPAASASPSPSPTLTGTPDSTAAPSATRQPTNTASPTVTPCPLQFRDVPLNSPFYDDIRCLACRGIVGGYTDAVHCSQGAPCFQPGAPVTRGQMSKFIAGAAGYSDVIPPDRQTFRDVPPDSPFWLFIERAAAHRVIGGYADSAHCPGGGPCFQPGALVTRGQTAKMVSGARGYSTGIPPTQQSFADVPPDSPFWLFIERVYGQGVISGYTCGNPEPCPGRYFRAGVAVTRGQTAKFITNAFFSGCATNVQP